MGCRSLAGHGDARECVKCKWLWYFALHCVFVSSVVLQCYTNVGTIWCHCLGNTDFVEN